MYVVINYILRRRLARRRGTRQQLSATASQPCRPGRSNETHRTRVYCMLISPAILFLFSEYMWKTYVQITGSISTTCMHRRINKIHIYVLYIQGRKLCNLYMVILFFFHYFIWRGTYVQYSRQVSHALPREKCMIKQQI